MFFFAALLSTALAGTVKQSVVVVVVRPSVRPSVRPLVSTLSVKVKG